MYRLHFRPKTPPPVEKSESEESSTSDSEDESTLSPRKSEQLPYPFPPEATSICVDFETDRMIDDEPPFTTEFNIADYFSETMSDFDLTLTTTGVCVEQMTNINNDWRTEELGSSRFHITSDIGNLFAPIIRPTILTTTTTTTTTQCSVSANSVNTSNIAPSSTTSSSGISNSSNNGNQSTAAYSNTFVSTQCTSSVEANNQHNKLHRQLLNNSANTSILSKSLTSPTNNKSCCNDTGGVRVIGTTSTVTSASGSGSSSGTNCGNGHQNGPIVLVPNTKGLQNSTHIVNNQSTILLSQKHTPSNLLPGFNKLASLARQQQQQTQNQTQQIPTAGEITLNSNR